MGLIRRAHQWRRIDTILLRGQMSRAQRWMNTQMAAGLLVWGAKQSCRGDPGATGAGQKGSERPRSGAIQIRRMGEIEMQIRRKLLKDWWKYETAQHDIIWRWCWHGNWWPWGGLLINPLFTLQRYCLLVSPEPSMSTATSDFWSYLFHVT